PVWSVSFGGGVVRVSSQPSKTSPLSAPSNQDRKPAGSICDATRRDSLSYGVLSAISSAGAGQAPFHHVDQLLAARAVGGVVRAGVDAARLAVQLAALVARRRLLLDHRHHAARLLVLDLLLGRERVHVDVAVRTVLGALAAADAPVLDDDLARLAP